MEKNNEIAQIVFGVPYNDLTETRKSIIDLLCDEETIFKPQDQDSFLDKLADNVAKVGGSWPFIFGFMAALTFWVTWNVLFKRIAFDPYPFIFLNLVLSTLAAFQAPFIMMSQNRSAEKDRRHAEHDAHVNMLAELEVSVIHKKIDELLKTYSKSSDQPS